MTRRPAGGGACAGGLYYTDACLAVSAGCSGGAYSVLAVGLLALTLYNTGDEYARPLPALHGYCCPASRPRRTRPPKVSA